MYSICAYVGVVPHPNVSVQVPYELERAQDAYARVCISTCFALPQEYDTDAVKKYGQQLVMGTCIVSYIHWAWGSPQPLLFQVRRIPVLVHFSGAVASACYARSFTHTHTHTHVHMSIDVHTHVYCTRAHNLEA